MYTLPRPSEYPDRKEVRKTEWIRQRTGFTATEHIGLA